jgi:hypothetical protein
VPDLGQVPQLGPGIVAASLVPVVAILGVERVEGDPQVRAVSRGAQPPGAVPARRSVLIRGGEREPGRLWTLLTPGFFGAPPRLGTGASVPDGVLLPIGDRHAPGGLRVLRGGSGQVTGQPRVDRTDAGDLARPVGQVQQRGQRDGQVDRPGEGVSFSALKG